MLAEMAAEQGLKVLLVEQEDELRRIHTLSDQNSEKKINDLTLVRMER